MSEGVSETGFTPADGGITRETGQVDSDRAARVKDALAYWLRVPDGKINPSGRYSTRTEDPGSPGANLFETLEDIFATSRATDVNPSKAVTRLEQEMGFSDAQINRHLRGVTGAQIHEMARLLAESDLPLKFSETRGELAEEISQIAGRDIILQHVIGEHFTLPVTQYRRSPAEISLINLSVPLIHPPHSGLVAYPVVKETAGLEWGAPKGNHFTLEFPDMLAGIKPEDVSARFAKFKELSSR